MAHRNLRDDESDGSDFPMICDSSLNPCVRMTRAEEDNEADTSLTTPLQRLHISPQGDGRQRPSEMPCQNINSLDQLQNQPPTMAPLQFLGGSSSNVPIIGDSSLNPGVGMTREGVDFESDTTLTPQRTTPMRRWNLFPQRYGRKPCRHGEMDIRRHELLREALYAKACMASLEPPEDKSIKTLLVRRLNPSILEEDIRVQFGSYGEIESIRFLGEMGPAFVTYTTREEAEKAAQELSKGLVIKGQRLKLTWVRPQVLEPDQDSSNQAVGRRILSQLQNQPPAMAPLQFLGASRVFTVSSTNENNRASSSNVPIICDSSLNPGVGMTRDGVDFESDTTLTPQRRAPLKRWNLFPQRYGRKPFRHVEMASQNIDIRGHELLREELFAKACMGTLEPPEDKSIKTLLVRGLNPRILEQDIRVQFGSYGVIESIRFFWEKGRAFVTYTTREGAEKATQELSQGLVINGQRLTLTWGRPQVPEPEQDSSNQAVGRRILSQLQFIGASREFTVSSTS